MAGCKVFPILMLGSTDAKFATIRKWRGAKSLPLFLSLGRIATFPGEQSVRILPIWTTNVVPLSPDERVILPAIDLPQGGLLADLR